jgi:mannose-6-phosphate isomerase-like protein (cupin superfamily)
MERRSANERRNAAAPAAGYDVSAERIEEFHRPSPLLMGLTSSARDKLSSAYVMDSLFLMDFAPGGTNIPHNHRSEGEIYLLLRGSGDMVAGLDADRKEVRYAVTAGAAFFFKPGTQVGYYSHAREGQEHDLILAVRSRLPGAR